MNNNLEEIYELHEKFNKHAFANNLICECGLINLKECEDKELKEFLALMKDLIFKLFGDDEYIIHQIADINIPNLLDKHYLSNSFKNVFNLFALYGIQNFSPEVVKFILLNAKEDIIIENGDLSFILDQKLPSDRKNKFKKLITLKLMGKEDVELYKKYIQKFRIDNIELLFKIPFELYDKIKIAKDFCKYDLGDLEERIDIDDFIKKVDYILGKYKWLIINLPKKIIEKLISKKRYDLIFKLDPKMASIYLSQNNIFTPEELENIKDTFINKYKICRIIREVEGILPKTLYSSLTYCYIKIKDKIYEIK